MKLIGDIVNELVDPKTPVESPLLKTKVLASRIKNQELLSWVNNELKGYPNEEEVPAYRTAKGSISGTYSIGSLLYNNQPIATIGLPVDIIKMLHTISFISGVSTLESYVSENKSGTLEIPFVPEVSALMEGNIRKMGNPYFRIISSKKYCSISGVVQILGVIRSMLLDFMLKLEEEFGHITDLDELKSKNTQITHIMNQTIITTTGDGNVVNTGDSANINANIEITKGNKDQLKKALQQHNIAEEDIDGLIEIIDIEEPNIQAKTFGTKVNSWMQKMLGKALDGSWQIGVGAAGSLLAEVIQNYYGIK